jgi:hypothetical protein
MLYKKNNDILVWTYINLETECKKYGFEFFQCIGLDQSVKKYNEFENSQKKQVFFMAGDYEDNLDFLKENNNDIILRQSFTKSKKKKNEILIPSSYDLLAGDKDMEPCPITSKPKISFCGSRTSHPCRNLLFSLFEDQTEIRTNFIFRDEPCKGLTDDEIEQKTIDFTDNMKTSEFVFCPRGNGNFSIRFYEALFSGRIPVVVESDSELPFENLIQWNNYIVMTTEDNLIKDIVSFYEKNDLTLIQQQCKKIFQEYFIDNFVSIIMQEINFLFHINYYLKDTFQRKWDIKLDPPTGVCLDITLQKSFVCPLEDQHGTYYISSEFSYEVFETLFDDRFLNRVKSGELTHNLKQLKRDMEAHEGIKAYNDKNYIIPMMEFFKSNPKFSGKGFLHRIGDVYFSTYVPIITKTKIICKDIESKKNEKNVILNLDSDRHFYNPIKTVQENDIDFLEKNNKMVWRGAPNGIVCQIYLNRPQRDIFVQKSSMIQNENIDIGFVYDYENLKGKGFLSIKEQLQSKFIVSVEGGDVATNLKWILYSNSVCLMPNPTMSSWYMEDLLQEWVHYVPLADDFSDIEEKYNWCLENMDKCQEISENASKFLSIFLDNDFEAKVRDSIGLQYVENVSICF